MSIAQATGLPGTNALAYLTSAIVVEEKVFIRLRPGPNVMKLFTSVIYEFL